MSSSEVSVTIRQLLDPTESEVHRAAHILAYTVGATRSAQAAAGWDQSIIDENFEGRIRTGTKAKAVYVIESEGRIEGAILICQPGVELPSPWKNMDGSPRYEHRIPSEFLTWQKETYFPWYKTACDRGFGPKGTSQSIYVVVFGVDPTVQGKGLGGKLLRHVIQIADEQGLPMTLTTQDVKSADWYKTFGFETTDVDTISLPQPDGEEMTSWCMVRPAKSVDR